MRTKKIFYSVVLVIIAQIAFCSCVGGKNHADGAKSIEDSLNYYYMSAYSLYSRFFIINDSLYQDTTALDMSLNLLNKGLIIDNDNTNIHSLMSVIYVYKHCYREALAENDIILKMSDNAPEAIFARAKIYGAIGDYEKCKTAVDECLYKCDSLLNCKGLEDDDLQSVLHISILATEYIYGSDSAVKKADKYMNMYPIMR